MLKYKEQLQLLQVLNMPIKFHNPVLFFIFLSSKWLRLKILCHENSVEIGLRKFYRNDQQDATVQDNLLFHCSLTAQHVSRDIIAHHQELLSCNYSFWVYSRLSLPAAVMAEWELYRSKHVEHSRNNGIINCPTQLHLAGHFYKICIMMHGSMNVKSMNVIYITQGQSYNSVNPLNAELNPIFYFLALLGAHHFLHVSRIRVKSLTLRLLMSYIYMEHLFLMFLDHTRRRTTVGRAPLDE